MQGVNKECLCLSLFLGRDDFFYILHHVQNSIQKNMYSVPLSLSGPCFISRAWSQRDVSAIMGEYEYYIYAAVSLNLTNI